MWLWIDLFRRVNVLIRVWNRRVRFLRVQTRSERRPPVDSVHVCGFNGSKDKYWVHVSESAESDSALCIHCSMLGGGWLMDANDLAFPFRQHVTATSSSVAVKTADAAWNQSNLTHNDSATPCVSLLLLSLVNYSCSWASGFLLWTVCLMKRSAASEARSSDTRSRNTDAPSWCERHSGLQTHQTGFVDVICFLKMH